MLGSDQYTPFRHWFQALDWPLTMLLITRWEDCDLSIEQEWNFTHVSEISSFLTDDDTRSICGQCRSISDHTECTV